MTGSGILDRSESRNGASVRVLAVHTSEGVDKPVVDDAAALRDASWWAGSSHAIADNDPGSLLTPADGCVPYDRASWTLRSGNRWSENIELIAQAGWSRAQWLARPTLLDRCAFWLAVRSKVDRGGGRRIPLVKLTPAQYRAGEWGVIGHHDHTVGYSDGTHWDPGPGFPWDVVLDKARAYAAGHTPDDEEIDMGAKDELWNAIVPRLDEMRGELDQLMARLPAIDSMHLGLMDPTAGVRNIVLQLAGRGVEVDAATFLAGLRPLLADAVREGMAADNGATADEIVDRLAARLAGPVS